MIKVADELNRKLYISNVHQNIEPNEETLNTEVPLINKHKLNKENTKRNEQEQSRR